MLRVAVPNKGVLSEPAAAMLAESGYRQRRTTSELAVYDPENDTEFFYLRPRDIAIYVAAGTLDVGITGRDMLLETTPPEGGDVAAEVMPLGFGRSSFRFASPAESPVDEVAKLEGKRIATAYPGLLQRFLDETGMKAAVVKLDGAVETACRLGVADAVCDVVETGTTLRAAGLRIIGDPVLASEAVLVGRAGADEVPAVAQLRRRLQGVLVARRYVMLDYDCPNDLLARATARTPGLEGPTVSPLQTPGWSAVRAMVLKDDTNRVMDELWELGARAILVTSIAASRI
ncbi:MULTISPECIES: ATP phosphoribosyltransferase [unclassified Modestobacter]|uniref:ATP phosphoribosyltransferase n=1 Tax=unclassified Modestobacter TaxID=2643866 RepID=UPI0022AB170D|nr:MULTISPECIES: ATP phosphoribosyltransferase [unclassified Modestobacter]MCZ2812808.1 ATP phosphoribosyltransferase [Modestobacter sp. VKM Ac-2979]MCZ2843163.1 ATP phosphoribosyltransferase [Modestobacter sp. VKM Ac-2980]MCZ2847770.1 ATP phosphoribosyltransferase [Modestobacter sp. VKM Ac-2978]